MAAVCARSPEDLISLRRRTRDVAEQCGLDERTIQSFAAATYEAARLLGVCAADVVASISIGASGELEVAISITDNDQPVPPDVPESLGQLKAVVARLQIEHDSGTTTLRLATPLPADHLPPTSPAAARSSDAGALAELHTELDDTNRALIALFAERDGQEERVREAARAKEHFLATLSHELRTPLNAMLGWTRLVRMGKLDQAAMSRALDTIERNAHAQEQLIADILDASRIVTGKLRLELRPLDLEPIIDAALDALRPAADAKGVELSCSLTRAGRVLGDPDRLQQVVWNLMSNAIKFTPSGGRVSIGMARSGGHVLITVADTGEGMPATLLPFIFDRFTQGDGSATRPHGGLGLGLSIVRHIVELHGGDVKAYSEGPGKGSTFVLTLPARTPERSAGFA